MLVRVFNQGKTKDAPRPLLVCGLNQWIGSADQSSVATAGGAGLPNAVRKRRWIARNNATFTRRIAIHLER